MQTIHCKPGDDFDLRVSEANADGSIPDLTGWTIAAQIRQADDTLIAALTFDGSDLSNGIYYLRASRAATTSWPVGVALCDLQYTSPADKVRSTETFRVVIGKEITHDG